MNKNISILLIGILIGSSLTYNLTRNIDNSTETRQETRIKVLLDTLSYSKIEPVRTQKIEKLIPVPIIQKEKKIVHDTIYLQAEQKVYSAKHYKAYISGYDVKLDSINIFHKTIRETQIRTRYKRFSYGLQGGFGITPKGFQPYIGFGISIRF